MPLLLLEDHPDRGIIIRLWSVVGVEVDVLGRAAIGTPSAAVMTKGGASICGGLMCAAVVTGVTGWITVASGEIHPHHDLGPQLLFQLRQL